MSTKAIRKALERLATLEDGSTPEVIQALLEVERIERAASAYCHSTWEDEPRIVLEVMESIEEDAP